VRVRLCLEYVILLYLAELVRGVVNECLELQVLGVVRVQLGYMWATALRKKHMP
jgi:hypothetical protein